MTGDESWFVYLYESDHMFASGRENVITREKQTIEARKVMLTIFFSRTRLTSLEALPHDRTYTQEYFIGNILPDLVNEKMQNRRRSRAGQFFISMDNSICDNSRKIAQEIYNPKLERLSRPAYSAGLRPCDFWLFGLLKEKMRDRALQTVEEILEAITLIWNAISFEQLQSVFFN
jgi:hypothetical protein